MVESLPTNPDFSPPELPAELFDGTTPRGRLLRAAAVVFARHGVEAPAIEHILIEAGVSRRTFYKHFANRDALLIELHRELTERVLATTLSSISTPTTPSERIARAVDVLIGVAVRGGSLFRVLQMEAARPGSALASRRTQVLGRFLESTTQAFVAAGRSPPDPLYLQGLMAGVETILQRGAAEGPLDEARTARLRALMIRLLEAGLAAAS